LFLGVPRVRRLIARDESVDLVLRRDLIRHFPIDILSSQLRERSGFVAGQVDPIRSSIPDKSWLTGFAQALAIVPVKPQFVGHDFAAQVGAEVVEIGLLRADDEAAGQQPGVNVFPRLLHERFGKRTVELVAALFHNQVHRRAHLFDVSRVAERLTSTSSVWLVSGTG